MWVVEGPLPIMRSGVGGWACLARGMHVSMSITRHLFLGPSQGKAVIWHGMCASAGRTTHRGGRVGFWQAGPAPLKDTMIRSHALRRR